MPVIDAYTPLQEGAEALLARHVGREDERAAISRYLEALRAGPNRPLPMWICGSRGIGKSHLIALAADAAREIGLEVALLPEDLPVSRTAEELLGSERPLEDAPWASWAPPRAEHPDVYLIEGLDRHLASMTHAQQGELRRRLHASRAGLIATGVGVPESITGRDRPLYGMFDVWRLPPLSLEEAERLMTAVVGLPVDDDAAKIARRRALVRLAGGNPRALVALAQAAGADPADVATVLADVLRIHVPHYQLRFRDLSPDAQQVVSAMAAAPRGVRPKELRGLVSNPSVVLGRLFEEAVVVREERGRAAWYLLAEPLFRFWLEYRQGDWEGTRAAAVARLLGEVLTRRELVDVWWGTEGELRQALEGQHAIEIILGLLGELKNDAAAAERLATMSMDPRTRGVVLDLVHQISPTVLEGSLPADAPAAHRAVVEFVLRLAERDRAKAFRALLRALAKAAPGAEMAPLAQLVVRALHASEPRGAPIQLDTRYRAHLREIPFLRARFAVEGRRPHHAPFLTISDLEAMDPADDAPDIPDLLAAAHQLQLPDVFARLAGHPRAGLSFCPRPDLLVPSRVRLVELLVATQPATRWTWAASASLLDPSEWRMVLRGSIAAPAEEHYFGVTPALVTALVGLGTRSPERLGDLEAHDPALRGAIAQARRLLAQLDARHHGPLQPELGLLWEAVRPDPDREK